jgi:hypothetical protein
VAIANSFCGAFEERPPRVAIVGNVRNSTFLRGGMEIACTSRTNAKQQWTPFDGGAVTEGDEMNSDYVFLCGVMWCRYGQQEAGRELLRAALSRDPDISTLAWAMFAKGKTALRQKSLGKHPSIEP